MSRGRTLVVVDMQLIFGSKDSPWFTDGFYDIVPEIATASSEFDTVVATRFLPHEVPSGSWIDYYREWQDIRGARFESYFDLVPEVANLAQAVIVAPTFSKWGDSLSNAVRGDIYLVGVATECCVLSTALSAIDHGKKVLVVEDLCRGGTEDLHRSALSVLRSFAPQCELIHSKGI